MSDAPIYHMCKLEEWQAAQAAGSYAGSSQDKADGFIHFSTAGQVRESAAKHRTGQDGLVLLSVDPIALGSALKWEPSRGGLLFPHLYGALSVTGVIRFDPLPLSENGQHDFPKHVPDTDGAE